MANSKSGRVPSCCFAIAISALSLRPAQSYSQQPVNGFAVERFYPSPPGSGWFVMNDLNMGSGLGGAITLTGGYERNPLLITGPDGRQQLAVVAGEGFVDLGLAVTYSRFRLYLNLPLPLDLAGTSGILGPYRFTAPAVNVGKNPDSISDTRLGFDARLYGNAESALRLGVGAQLIFPSGSRSDYVTDARYRGMLRFLAAGDAHNFSYAGQLGVHFRPLNDSPAPGSPVGNEMLFGISAARRFALGGNWAALVGPELFGETSFQSFLGGPTGTEGLLTGRFETNGPGRNFRIKMGVGHGFKQSFGAPEWRVLLGVEVFAQRPKV